MPIPHTANINPPQQSRSKRTLERIVAASLEILASEGLSGLTVHNVVDRANSSVGSFYARFEGKDDLLDYLGERVWAEALERWNDALANRDWSGLALDEVVEGSIHLLIEAQRSRSAYLKALDWASGRPSGAYETFRAQLLVGLGDLLLRHRDRMTHPNPELAVRIGLRAVLGVIDAEFRAVADRLDNGVLIEECRGMLMSYLTGSTGEPGGAEGVDFFDVWG